MMTIYSKDGRLIISIGMRGELFAEGDENNIR
jgi:hypothetical protein